MYSNSKFNFDRILKLGSDNAGKGFDGSKKKKVVIKALGEFDEEEPTESDYVGGDLGLDREETLNQAGKGDDYLDEDGGDTEVGLGEGVDLSDLVEDDSLYFTCEEEFEPIDDSLLDDDYSEDEAPPERSLDSGLGLPSRDPDAPIRQSSVLLYRPPTEDEFSQMIKFSSDIANRIYKPISSEVAKNERKFKPLEAKNLDKCLPSFYFGVEETAFLVRLECFYDGIECDEEYLVKERLSGVAVNIVFESEVPANGWNDIKTAIEHFDYQGMSVMYKKYCDERRGSDGRTFYTHFVSKSFKRGQNQDWSEFINYHLERAVRGFVIETYNCANYLGLRDGHISEEASRDRNYNLSGKNDVLLMLLLNEKNQK
ncbi:MAG: hypothetical protein ABIG93_02215 [archaeon]|nr:hypothetical protein [Nanoarchaeota archaeon]